MYFEPVQLGIGTLMGAGAACMQREHGWTEAEADAEVLFQMDLSNAFSSVSRMRVLNAVRVGGCMLDFSPPHIVVGDVTIPSAQGVQKCDPVAPVLFSLAAH